MQTAVATTASRWRTRTALSGLLVAALFALVGCSLLPTALRLPTPTAASYLYVDKAAGFAITFPGKPTIAPIRGQENGAQRATYSTTVPETAPNGIYYTAGGTKASANEVDIETTLHVLVETGQIALTDPDVLPQEIKLGGLPGFKADVTMSDGKTSTLIMAGEGHTLYQLQVIGGTPKQRQVFFDSFELRG